MVKVHTLTLHLHIKVQFLKVLGLTEKLTVPVNYHMVTIINIKAVGSKMSCKDQVNLFSILVLNNMESIFQLNKTLKVLKTMKMKDNIRLLVGGKPIKLLGLL